MRRVPWFLVGVVMAAVVGCASGASGPSESAGPPSVDVTGVWAGIWRQGGDTGAVTLRLHQTDATVVGDLTAAGGSNNGAIEGTVVGNQFTWRRLSGIGSDALLSVNGDEMKGFGITGVRLQLQRQR